MSRQDLPPFIQKAELVRAMAERAVASWSRANRHDHGGELRRQAKVVVGLAHRAWTDRVHRAQLLVQLSDAIDVLKADLRLGQHIRLFRSWGQFDEIMREARDLGNQCGALKRKHPLQEHSKGQNVPASRAGAARPDTEYPGRLSGAMG